MDMDRPYSHYPGMQKRPQKPVQPFRRQFRLLYIGQWIRALGKRPIDVVTATGLTESYLSLLISGKRKNPSAHVLATIAEYLEIPISYLYRPPPDQQFLEKAAEIDPSVLVRLRGNG